MNRTLFLLSTLLITTGVSSAQPGDTQDAPTPQLNEKLSALRPFVGITWVGGIPGDSRMGEIILRWEVVLNGFAVKLVRTIPQSNHLLETTYYWDESLNKIAFVALSNNGFVTKGHITLGEGELICEGLQQGPDTRRQVRRTYRLGKEGTLSEDDQYRSSDSDGWRRTHLSVYVSK